MPSIKPNQIGLPLSSRQQDILFARRDFIKLMGASISILSLNACRNRLPPTSIVPMVKKPAQRTLGESEFFTTVFPMPDFAQGVVVTVHEGRPTKIEGNPIHPASLGATSAFAQASILDLYDPYRLDQPTYKKKPTTLKEFKNSLNQNLDEMMKHKGQGIEFLIEGSVSPSWISELSAFSKQYTKANLSFWDPIQRDALYLGTRNAFGESLDISYDFRNANTVVAIDFDFLGSEPGFVRNAHDFYRSQNDKNKRTTRLYAVESSITLTGAKADHRLPIDCDEIVDFVSLLECEINQTKCLPHADEIMKVTAREIASELISQKGKSIVAIGSHHDPDLQARIHRLNSKLSNIGKTILLRKPLDIRQCRNLVDLEKLLSRADKGEIDTLFVIGGNPIYTAPTDFEIKRRLRTIKSRVHLTSYENETSAECDWVIPMQHYLESWGDVCSEDGSVSLMQPIIEPLHASLSKYQLLNCIRNMNPISDFDVVKGFWKKHFSHNFEPIWHKALQDGVLSGLAKNSIRPLHNGITAQAPAAVQTKAESSGFKISLRPDPTIWDGQFGENAWMQELPKPFSNLTWDNALLLSPQMAKDLELANEDVIEITTRSVSSFKVPILIVEGLPAKTGTLHLGYGRKVASPVNLAAGFNAFELRTSTDPWFISIEKWRKTKDKYALATTSSPDLGKREDIYRESIPLQGDAGIANAIDADIDIGRALPTEAIGQDLKSNVYQWGMSIDLNSCVGCSACVIACQAENNIPVVGKAQVLNGRVMHWIRIDRYQVRLNEAGRPQPIACMHCEKAPCEVVCPVQATNHSSEGLNQMVYNRCVGTRYCSNNCPYKVRRFNFYKFVDEHEILKMQRNPDVSVRDRGVMEKCTYCVQRIQKAHIDADKVNRRIHDGEIRTACEAVCPTGAIVFGNILDPNSHVRHLRDSVRSYGVLTQLGTRPRTTYLQAMRNPNSKLGSLE